MKRIVAAVAGLLAFAAVPSHAEDGIKPGLWKVTTVAINNGMKIPPQERMRCLTAEQASNIAETFSPKFGGVNSDCERTGYEKTEQKMTWHLECKGQLNMDVVGEFWFDSSIHYTATVATKGSMAGQQILNSVSALEGEYVGECL
jgi:hypothetical protein